MKILILALDSLEYNLVVKYNLKNLKQVEYGKVELPIKPHEEAHSPVIFASFITGKMPEEHGITGQKTWKYSILRWINRKFSLVLMGQKLRSAGFKSKRTYKGKTMVFEKKATVWNNKLIQLGSIIVNSKFVSELLESIESFMKERTKKSHYKYPTIFDDIEKSIAVSVPSYNRNPTDFKSMKYTYNALGEDAVIPKSEVEEFLRSVYEKKKSKLFKLLKEDWNMIMVHFTIPDLFQHLYFRYPNKIKNFYKELDSFVRDVKSKISDDVFVLIMSDHGQERGFHTNHGFYSINKKLNLKNVKITDFRDIILTMSITS